MLPEDLKIVVEPEAMLQGVSFGELVRLALKKTFFPKKNRIKNVFTFDRHFDLWEFSQVSSS